jgi:hypothetical protein
VITVGTFRKDPAALLDFVIDFSTVLEHEGDRLASVVWTVPAGITLGSGAYAPTLSPDLRKASFWLEAGSTTGAYTVSALYTTTNAPPRIDEVGVHVIVFDP